MYIVGWTQPCPFVCISIAAFALMEEFSSKLCTKLKIITIWPFTTTTTKKLPTFILHKSDQDLVMNGRCATGADRQVQFSLQKIYSTMKLSKYFNLQSPGSQSPLSWGQWELKSFNILHIKLCVPYWELDPLMRGSTFYCVCIYGH